MFVLDFRNDIEDITKAFEPYYGRTVAPPTDPNLLFDTRADLTSTTCSASRRSKRRWPFSSPSPNEGPRRVYAPSTLPGAVQGLGRAGPAGLQGCPGQVRPDILLPLPGGLFGTRSWSGTTSTAGPWHRVLRDQNTSTAFDLGSEVELTHLRSEVTFEGSLTLDSETGEVKSIFGEGRGKQKEPELELLSQIVYELNDRFGLNLDEQDKFFSISSRRLGGGPRGGGPGPEQHHRELPAGVRRGSWGPSWDGWTRMRQSS